MPRIARVSHAAKVAAALAALVMSAMPGVAQDAYPARPITMVVPFAAGGASDVIARLIAAGRDQVVSTAAIEDLAIRLRAGSHLIIAGARHEIMMEQDRYRAQFWAAFDAFVPGTPLFK